MMNLVLRRRFRGPASGMAAYFIVSILLDLATVTLTIAQTKDYPQPSNSTLGQISGRVSRSDTGEPVPKAQVALYAADADTGKAAGRERIVRTVQDGRFVFPDLPAGSYGISVWHNGFSEYSRQESNNNDNNNNDQRRFISLKPGQKLENLALRLHPTGVIAGQVSDEDEEAVQDLEVFALWINFEPGGRKQVSAAGRTVTDDLGNFRLPNLPPGPYYVSAGGLVQHPMGAEELKESPTAGMHYRNTFYPGTPSLDEAQSLKVGPELTTNDIRFTVPTERTYSITGKVLSRAGRQALKNAEVSCERVRSRIHVWNRWGNHPARIRFFLQIFFALPGRLHAQREECQPGRAGRSGIRIGSYCGFQCERQYRSRARRGSARNSAGSPGIVSDGKTDHARNIRLRLLPAA